jgi:signal transduction histidine kinase
MMPTVSAERPRVSGAEIHAHRMELIGRLASGLAHELNTPVQFAGDSVSFIARAFTDLAPVLASAERLVASPSDGVEALVRELRDGVAAADLPYLRGEVPDACDSAATGIQRIGELSRAIAFLASRPDDERVTANLNEIVETVLVIARHEYKYHADVVLDLAQLPGVPCMPAGVAHALLTLVLNAAEAVAARRAGSAERGRITIRSSHAPDHVRITVSDDGNGIPAEVRDRIFDSRSTSAAEGQRLGRGLEMACAIIAGGHAGTLTFESTLGVGTTFELTLPLSEGDRRGVDG